jgi:DNA gyrase/topoisomerase IV subunit B
MDPTKRRLLKVRDRRRSRRGPDLHHPDGDEVEPRREFIEKNALGREELGYLSV